MKVSWSRIVGITALVFMLWLEPGWGQGTNPTMSDAQNNTAGGTNALVNNLNLPGGFDNTAFGFLALSLNTTGFRNTAVGYDALEHNDAGFRNSAVGFHALHVNDHGG